MRQTCLNHVHELARKDPRVFFIGSDLGVGTLDGFKKDFPGRFFMEGISEANIIGMAAGLALEGKIVYVNSIATFLTRRSFEQICIDLCLHNLPVRLIGNGGGLVYAPLGPTHMATEDLAIMRALPNMTVVAPADAREMSRFMALSLEWPGPIYIRVAKGGDPVVSDDSLGFAIGKGLPIRKGNDALLVTTGITLRLALEAAEQLAKDGIRAAVLHMPTIKPFDAELFLDMAQQVKAVITLEEHSVVGGLGGAAAELLAETGSANRPGFKRIGIPDMFPDQYGSQASLMSRFGITSQAAAQATKELLSA